MKTKNKNKVTTKKTTKPSKEIKPVGKEIKTTDFGTLFYGNTIEKNIITKANSLMNALTGIKKKQIPELALALRPYMAQNKKIKLTMAQVKKYVFNLVGYKTITKEGLLTRNDSFESNVARAVKVAFLMDSKKTNFQINDKLEIVAPSNILYPEVPQFKPNGKKLKMVKNTDKDMQPVRVAEIEKVFAEKILNQKSDNNKLKPTPKDTKVKEVLIDSKLKDVKNYLLGLNSMSVDALTESNFKGSVRKEVGEIATIASLLIAKVRTIDTNEKGKNETSNPVLFSSKYSSQHQWATTHLRNAVKNISEEPKVANTK